MGGDFQFSFMVYVVSCRKSLFRYVITVNFILHGLVTSVGGGGGAIWPSSQDFLSTLHFHVRFWNTSMKYFHYLVGFYSR